MPRMTPCPSCHSHVMTGERQCPHCGAPLRTTTASRAPAVLLGLALAGCPGDDQGNTSTSIGEPEYGVPDTSTATMTVGTSGDSTTEATTSEGSTTDGSTSETSTDSAGEAEYGVPETGDSTTSAGEPDYGVPETSG